MEESYRQWDSGHSRGAESSAGNRLPRKPLKKVKWSPCPSPVDLMNHASYWARKRSAFPKA